MGYDEAWCSDDVFAGCDSGYHKCLCSAKRETHGGGTGGPCPRGMREDGSG